MKRGQFYGIIFSIALLSVLVFAMFFVIGVISKPVSAEFPEGDTIVYLRKPDTTISGITINGQSEFIIYFSGSSQQTISTVEIEIGNGATSLGIMYCLESYLDIDLQWHLMCDTMAYPNDEYHVTIRAFDSVGSEVLLVGGAGSTTFGPISIFNDFSFVQPQIDENIVSGNINLRALISGMVKSVSFTEVFVDNPSVTLAQDATPEYESFVDSKWRSTWDTSLGPDGNYVLSLSYVSLGGVPRPDVFVRQITVDNESNEPISCQWECDDWSECLSTAIQTRTCTEINGCGSDEGRPAEEQACTFVSPEDNTNTNTNIDGTSEPDGNTISSEPPNITMRYPEQGDTVSGDVILKARIEGAVSEVDFFYRTQENYTHNLIGQAHQSTTNDLIWQRQWHTDDLPDGEYFVFARVKDSSGQFHLSNFVLINVSHEAVTTDTTTPTNTFEPDVYDEIYTESQTTDENINRQELADNVQEKVASGEITAEQAADILVRFDKVILDQPTTSGVETPDKLRVLKIENISPIIGQNNLVISGFGPPNTFITLFIYSNPIVVTTKTDASGNFVYILDKDLLDGKHEVYVTITDSTGKIKEKSSPLTFFIRRAQAVSEEEYLRGDVDVIAASQTAVTNYLIIAFVLVGGVLVLFFGIYYMSRRKNVS